jgi:LPS sulfotransferase NodH
MTMFYDTGGTDLLQHLNGLYLRSRVTRFVVLFVERSGSTYLTTLLDSHPDLHVLREQFAVMRQQGKTGEEQLAWLRSFYTPGLISRYAGVGFKTKLVDILDPEGFVKLLHEHGVRVIQLQRRNVVKGAVSTLNARRLREVSGNWNLLKEDHRLPPFAIDPEEFDACLQQRLEDDRALEAFVARLNLPILRLYYEEMLVDEAGFLQRVFDFLQVKPKPVKGKTLKNTSDDLRQALLNFDELRARYAGTPYEAMFDEVLLAPAHGGR